ncbi:hypothetical protein BDR26DRAFT_857573 [Obelidium mucronatum]|nr:hypothetical protein BDR26DRAFT_857573 [Obelidium mucronatum]
MPKLISSLKEATQQPPTKVPAALPPRPLNNPFGSRESLKSSNNNASKNPFGVLKAIESSSGGSFPTATRSMLRYNSSPNILQTSAWRQREPLVSRTNSRIVDELPEEEEDDDEDQDHMSDLEPSLDNEDIAAFRMACSMEDNHYLSGAASSKMPCLELLETSNPSPETTTTKITTTTTAHKPRLFSILVEKKTAAFEKATFTSCNDAFKIPPKRIIPDTLSVPPTKQNSSEVSAAAAAEAASHVLKKSDFTIDYDMSSEELGNHIADYSMKTGLTLISGESQPWFYERTEAEKYSTLQNYIQKIPLHSLTPKQQFDHCLMTYIYPNGPKAPTHVGLMTRVLAIKPGTILKPFEQSELNFYLAKEEEWRQSFKSVFSSLEAHQADYFYYMNSEFTILFQGPGGSCSRDFYAVLTKASPGLRNVLQTNGIPFEAVVPPGKVKKTYSPVENTNEDERREARDELKEMEVLQPGRTIAKSDNNRAPIPLIFRGLESLLKLRDYLLRWVEQRIEKRALNQPVLVSPSPFLNASVKLAEVLFGLEIHD